MCQHPIYLLCFELFIENMNEVWFAFRDNQMSQLSRFSKLKEVRLLVYLF